MKKFLLGLIIGAIITALLTPQTGKELQDDLIKKVNDLQKKLKKFDIKDVNIAETKTVLKEKLDDAKQLIEDFDWEKSKRAVQGKFDEVAERLNEIKEQLANPETVIVEPTKPTFEIPAFDRFAYESNGDKFEYEY